MGEGIRARVGMVSCQGEEMNGSAQCKLAAQTMRVENVYVPDGGFGCAYSKKAASDMWGTGSMLGATAHFATWDPVVAATLAILGAHESRTLLD